MTIRPTVAVADPDLVESTTLVAVTVIGFVAGKEAGAIYVPPEIVPVCAFPPVAPFTAHVTAELKAPVP
jgi:hypothetical protein